MRAGFPHDVRSLSAIATSRFAAEGNFLSALIRGQECPRHTFYFNTNIAFTCAVTVTFWGENSSVGVGPCAAIAMGMARRCMGAITRMFSEVSTEAYESSPSVRPLAAARDCAEA